MSFKKNGNDVGTNLKIIEWLKAELVDTVAVLMKSMLKAGSDATGDALATLIIIAYVLGRRVGINFQLIDMRVKYKLNTNINETSEIQQWYGDLSELKEYLENKEKKMR
ncbi:MAG: MazG-like family protein [Syntrophomonas sp.]|nr:MazG-like family protein [Syntrophomonas sp.]